MRHAYGERRDQFGELTRPEGTQGPWPVAVLIHGRLAGIEGGIECARLAPLLAALADGEAVWAVHGEVFGDVRPASAFIVVSGFLDPRWRVEIEADAIVASD